jgi:hypothetical protein
LTKLRTNRVVRFAVWPDADRPGVYGAAAKATTLLIRAAIVVLFFTVLAGSRGWTSLRVAALVVATAALVVSAASSWMYARERG